MIAFQRILFSDNGTFSDFSPKLNDFAADSETMAFVAAEDHLYIGSDLPFNHRWFDVSTANSAASVVSVQIWDGNEWQDAVDVVDQTSVSGVSLAQSGYISFNVDRNDSWAEESTTEDITNLTSQRIYDKYWARFIWSADLSGTTALKYIGFKFADDDDLQVHYPDLALSATKTAFESGKTDWNEQHFAAAEEILRHLVKKGIVWSKNQVLDYLQFNQAGVHKVAEIIMNAFGDDFEDNRVRAKQKFFEGMNLGVFRTDRDEDGRVDDLEKRPFRGLVRR